MRPLFFSVFIPIIVVGITGCQPKVISFQSDKRIITAKDSVHLSWEVRQAVIVVFLILGGFSILLAMYAGMFDIHSLSEGSSALLFGTGIVSLLIWLAVGRADNKSNSKTEESRNSFALEVISRFM